MFEHATLSPPPSLPDLCRERPVALFLDFDGTLVDLAPTPDSISVPATMADDLATLSERLDHRLALVSGRAIPDLQRHLGPLRVARAGSHGIARELADGSALGEMPAALPEEAAASLRTFAAEHGFALEEKPHGAALHFRIDPGLEPAGLAYAQQLASVHLLEVKRGKSVIELVRPGVSKEGAVRAFMQVAPFAGAVPIFIGDDITDEDGFRAADDLGGFGILVGDRTPTRARYQLPDTAAVHDWLAL
ncbi:trehalose-phosphatase [Croceibacterium ferulae]|uniref:trehalose-phosphatase n=1 Tax=Croceibacterium ferulae TaxID=1854641 RepID=UPI000EAC40B7|nr:trehalose-phosphatase [Croceibacterium ferulae]